MNLRGVVHGRTIELEEDPCLPDGSVVEVELIPQPPLANPFWGTLHDYAELLTEIEQEIMTEREQIGWRPDNGKGVD